MGWPDDQVRQFSRIATVHLLMDFPRPKDSYGKMELVSSCSLIGGGVSFLTIPDAGISQGEI